MNDAPREAATASLLCQVGVHGRWDLAAGPHRIPRRRLPTPPDDAVATPDFIWDGIPCHDVRRRPQPRVEINVHGLLAGAHSPDGPARPR